MQKVFVTNTLTHKRIKNRGELPQTYIKNGHPAIIDRKTWNAVQKLIENRRKQYKINSPARVPGFRSIWAYFLVCPYCGKNYTLKTSRATGRKILIDSSNREVLTCRKSQSVYVDVLEKIIVEQVSILYHNFIDFKEALTNAYSTHSKENEVTLIKKEMDELQTKINSLDNSNEATSLLKGKLMKRLKDLMQQLSTTEMHENEKSLSNDRMDTLLDIIKKYKPTDSIQDINFRDLFTNIIVINRDKLFFTIGNVKTESINENTSSLFSGKLDHKERATTFTTEFGIIIGE